MERIVLGVIFLILGVLGIIFPVIPGIPFLVISAFFFGIIPKDKVVKYTKKLKGAVKNRKLDKFINYVLIKYIYQKNPIKVKKSS
ncbi:MAG: DUF454 domain-containing protein [Aquificae bacterium]|nr:DUF454 domain-containing protein [Aquificota bacterium]